jgi:hypothetical protein
MQVPASKTGRGLRRTFLASLLLVVVYVAGGWLDSSATRDFTHATPFADLPSGHSKGQRPVRLQWTQPQAEAGQIPSLRFGFGSVVPAAGNGAEWPNASQVVAFAPGPDVPPL